MRNGATVAAALVALSALVGSTALAQSVAEGAALYASVASGGVGCVSCHGGPAGSNPDNSSASNNPAAIVTAIANVADMNLARLTALTAQQRLSIALFIGQQKTPLFNIASLSMTIRAGSSASKNIYPNLLSNGTGGAGRDTTGVAVTAASFGTSGTSQSGGGSTMNYIVSYNASAVPQTTGVATFNATVTSSPGGASSALPVSVTVLGITNSILTATGFKGQNYPPGAALYTATCSGGCAANSFSVDPTTPLPAGLMIGTSSGEITGTPAVNAVTGAIPVTLRANSTGAVDSGNGQVTKDITLTIHGITSPATVSFNQGVANPGPYQITASAPINGLYSISSVPAGLVFDAVNGRLNGQAVNSTGAVPIPVTISASTTAGVLTQQLDITVVSAGAPLVSTNMPPSTTEAAGTVGTSIDSKAYKIDATNPPIFSYSAVAAPGSVLPGGINFNTGNGQITGIPSASGDFNLLLGATNSGGAAAAAPLPITIRINPNTAPVITSGNPPPSNVGAPFNYQVVASNAPITGYTELAPKVLSTIGLALDPVSGIISGTPTTSGAFSVKIAATNVVAEGASTTLSITILPTTLSAITSPTFATMGAGVPIAPIQVVATNAPIEKYLATGLPDGLVLDENTGVISGNPKTPGSYPVSLSAKNFVGVGAARVVPFSIGIPAPTACAITLPFNTSATLDLATCLFPGFAPTGITIVSTAAHGSAVASGTKVTYTPVRNYFGSDSFTFVGSGAGGKSPQGTVTITVTGRPDPTEDPAVTGLITAQTEAAQRFSRAQITNYQRRMESLHRGGSNSAAAITLQGGAPSAPATGFAAAATQVAPAAASTATLPAGWPPSSGMPTPGSLDALTRPAPVAASESQVVDAVMTGLGLKAVPLANGAMSLLKSRSVNLAGVASGFGLNAAPDKTGATEYWIEGVASFGTRDANGDVSGTEFSSSGVTIGVDRRFSDDLVVGFGLGYGRDKTSIGNDGTNNRSKAYSLAIYGSYQPSASTYIDALLGYGTLDFDSTRLVAPINEYAKGQRDGTQWFGSLVGGYEYRDSGVLISPYGRIDFSNSQLKTSSETGAGAFALTYFNQNATSVQGALGLRGESVHGTNFGYAIPRARAEYWHQFQGAGQAFVGYADQIGGPRYPIAPNGGGNNALVLGVGSDFLFRDGLTLSLEYQLNRITSNDSSYAFRLRLNKEFDVRGLPKLSMPYSERIGEPLDLQVDAGYTYDDNVTRAKSGPDKLSDQSYSLNVSKSFEVPLTEQSRIMLTGAVGGQRFHDYNGLSLLSATAEAELQYRDSSEFDDPTFGLNLKAIWQDYVSSLRDGYLLSAGVNVRQALTDRINLFGAVSYNWRNASSEVFSTRDTSVRGNVDYALGNGTMYLSAEYRKGELFSDSSASLEALSIAKVFVRDDAFPGNRLFSYKFDGSSVLLTLGYNLGLGPRDSLDFSWRYIQSSSSLRPAFATSPNSYYTNQFSVVYLLRF